LTGHSFFPSLISGPFQSGLQIAFDFSIAACLIAAVASLLRGKRYVHDELHGEPILASTGLAAAGDVTAADIAPVAIPADVIEAEAEVAAEAAGAGERLAIAEEIEDAERRLASPKLAIRYRKER
jgi:hypothetical protein